MDILGIGIDLAKANGLVFAFLFIGIVMIFAYKLSALTKGKIHGSAIAIFIGLILAYYGGVSTGGSKGLASIPLFSGLALMGGGMFRDFAIVSTAFGADLREIKKCGVAGVVSLFFGILSYFIIGCALAYFMGYPDVISMVTIGAGAVTFVVGPVTGAALGAPSDVIAVAIAAGVVKSVAVMLLTPFIKNFAGLDNPQSAMVYGGLIGTSSGVAAGLAAVDPKLVPYGAMTATFYTGLGCLLCPSVLYFAVRAIFG